MNLRPVSFEEVDAWSRALEDLVDQTPFIDPWCSGPDWVLSSNRAFAPEAEVSVSGDPETGLVLLARYVDHETGEVVLSGLEPMWGFASPVIGPDPVRLISELASGLSLEPDWDTLLLPGLPVDEPILRSMANSLSSLGPVQFGVAIERELVDLSDGPDAWLTRRSPRFRRDLRRRARQASESGIEIVDVSDDPLLFERIVGVENRSWKGKDGSGLASPEMSAMYSMMIDRLRHRGRVQALIAVIDGADAGYILGGIRGPTYRGLQISYDQAWPQLGIGHLLQWAQIERLAGRVGYYDMGMSIGYKERWADKTVPSPALVVRRGG